jgi:hypothetical protein
LEKFAGAVGASRISTHRADDVHDVGGAHEGAERVAGRRIGRRVGPRPEWEVDEVPLIVARVLRVELVGLLDLGRCVFRAIVIAHSDAS